MSLISSLVKYTVVIIVIIGVGFMIKKAVAKGAASVADAIPDITDFIPDFGDVFDGENARNELIKQQKQYMQQMFSIFDILNQKLDKIQNQLHELDDKLLHLHLETKFDNFYETLVDLKSAIEVFNKTVINYSYNSTRLHIEIDKFMESYKRNNYESKIIAYLEISVITAKAPIDELIDVIKKKSNQKFFGIKSSTNKFIFDFYTELLVVINTSGTLIINYYELESKIKNGKFKETVSFYIIPN